MNLSWKPSPLAALSALTLLALMPGGGVRPGQVAADACPEADRGTIRIHINESVGGAETNVLGFQVQISPDPDSTSHGGSQTAIDNGSNDDAGSDVGQIDFASACQTDHTGFSAAGYDINLSIIASSDADDLDCQLVDDEVDDVTLTRAAGASVDVNLIVNCASTTPTVTVTPATTGTPVTSTPTVTATPTGDTITLSAVQPNPQCGQAVFLFATVKSNSGAFVAGATVTFSASGGVGSFSPPSSVSVTDGVASSTYSPPTTGTQTVTITATTGGKTATASVPVNCGAASTATPVPAAAGTTVRPPSTGEAGLADDSSWTINAGLAVLIGTVFMGALVVARRRA